MLTLNHYYYTWVLYICNAFLKNQLHAKKTELVFVLCRNTSGVLNNLHRIILNYVNSSIFSTLYSGSLMF